jgi:hypothetical protein
MAPRKPGSTPSSGSDARLVGRGEKVLVSVAKVSANKRITIPQEGAIPTQRVRKSNNDSFPGVALGLSGCNSCPNSSQSRTTGRRASDCRRSLNALDARQGRDIVRFGRPNSYRGPVIHLEVSRCSARKRSAFPITLTDESAIAAAAMIGESNKPNTGYSTPAAIGTPAAL